MPHAGKVLQVEDKEKNEGEGDKLRLDRAEA